MGRTPGRVNVHSIYHKRGVNALAEDQTLKFGSGLTVVYGDNCRREVRLHTNFQECRSRKGDRRNSRQCAVRDGAPFPGSFD